MSSCFTDAVSRLPSSFSAAANYLFFQCLVLAFHLASLEQSVLQFLFK
jgi:hypothetical protein